MPVLDNPKHELFAQALARGVAQYLAYEQAGYAPDAGHASRLAAQGKIEERVKELQAEMAESLRLNDDYVISRLILNIERSLQGIPVLDKDGNETGQWQYNGAVANKALETLAKIQGLMDESVITERRKALAVKLKVLEKQKPSLEALKAEAQARRMQS